MEFTRGSIRSSLVPACTACRPRLQTRSSSTACRSSTAWVSTSSRLRRRPWSWENPPPPWTWTRTCRRIQHRESGSASRRAARTTRTPDSDSDTAAGTTALVGYTPGLSLARRGDCRFNLLESLLQEALLLLQMLAPFFRGGLVVTSPSGPVMHWGVGTAAAITMAATTHASRLRPWHGYLPIIDYPP